MLSKAPRQPLFSPRGATPGLGLLVVGCLVALALLASDASARQLPVRLGKAGSFAVLAGQTVTSAGFSTLNGDLGVSPGTSLTGFPPGKVNGTVHAADPVANQAQSDLTTAYNDAAGRTPPQALPADVGGRTLAPGVYQAGAALELTGTLTLDARGDPNAVFVFQVGSALTTAVSSRVNLIGGAQPCNVFWQIGSSATLGTSSVFAGDILAYTSVSMNDGVTLNGRALARNGAVTLINDTITAAHCAPGTPGGPTTPGGTTGGSTAPGGTTGAAPRAPAPPLLLSPRAHARVRAGTVRFRWRGAARAEGYILMVDHHQMNAGPLTRATMRISAGSHSYRVIARNRAGARSSSARAFSAITPRSVVAFARALRKFVRDLPSSIRSAVRAVERLFAQPIKAIIRFIKSLLHPRPPKISPNDPRVKAIEAFIREFANEAAITAGASNAREATRFIRRNKDTIVDAVKLYGRDHRVGRAGAYLIARGVRNPRLKNAIVELYKYGAKVGDGSTMDALEAEARYGVKVGGRSHLQKAIDFRTNLIKEGGVLSEKLSPTERKIAGDLVKRLNRAIAHAQAKR